MLRKLMNEAYFTLRITATGPLLVKSGYASVSGPDMTPVLTFRNKQKEVFLPGSSLKGVFRSHIEKIVCSLRPHVVCYPFSSSEDSEEVLKQRRKDYLDSCSAWFTKRAKFGEDSTESVYTDSCPACRLFGSTGFIGRVAIEDAYVVTEQTKERRDGVGIDRLTGGASNGAKFELEVVSSGVAFETDIHLRNFEMWQLGMLFVVIQDMEDELVRIGSGRSRGLGRVKAQIVEESRNGRPGGVATCTIRGNNEPDTELWGLGRWLNDGSYGTERSDFVPLAHPERVERGIRSVCAFTGENLQALQRASINAFIERIKNWPPRSQMATNSERSH